MTVKYMYGSFVGCSYAAPQAQVYVWDQNNYHSHGLRLTQIIDAQVNMLRNHVKTVCVCFNCIVFVFLSNVIVRPLPFFPSSLPCLSELPKLRWRKWSKN